MNQKVIGIIILIIIIGAAVVVGVVMKNNKSGIFSGQSANNGTTTGQNGQTVYGSKPAPLTVTGFGAYKLDKITLEGEEIPLIKIPLVTWGGYAALFAANNGIKPNKDSLFYKYGKFVVQLVDEEDSGKQLQGFASGTYPILWSTMDMVPLVYEATKLDKRVIPQVFGVFDWSFGGDGIIVRGDIKSPADLKGKRIVCAGNTPSNFFLLWLLSQSNLKNSDVVIQYVSDAIAAKDAFIKDKKLDACVTWSPFLYELTDPQSKSYNEGSRLLITSKDANQLIADCYLTRLDFVKEHPEIIAAFSKAMMEGFDRFNTNKQLVYASMAELFKLGDGAHEAELMLGDVHIANFPENQMFFDPDNAISAYKIVYLAQDYYKGIGSLGADTSVEPEQVIFTKFLEDMKAKGLFATQQNTVKNSFNKQSSFNIADLESTRTVLTENLSIYFDPQQITFDLNSQNEEVKKNLDYLRKIAEQMQVLGTTIVKLVGHLDTSKVEEYKAQGQQFFIEASAQAKLISKKRAEFIKKILVEKFGCDPQRIITEGKGWDQPIDTTDQSKNRRVEVQFLSLE